MPEKSNQSNINLNIINHKLISLYGYHGIGRFGHNRCRTKAGKVNKIVLASACSGASGSLPI